MFRGLRRKKQEIDRGDQKPLVNNIIQHTESTDGKPILAFMENTSQSGFGEHPDVIASSVEVTGERVLSILKKILSGHSNHQDFDTAAAMVKTWGKLNGFRQDGNEGGYSHIWLSEYLQEIDEFVESHFPTLPEEGPQRSGLQLQEFLKIAESVMQSEVLQFTPVLKDAGLLGHLIDSFSYHLCTKLDLLLERDLSVNEILCLLQWVKCVFCSPDKQDVFKVSDPLQLAEWTERAKEKLLQVLRNEISRTLQGILSYEEKHEYNGDSMDEETFIRVHIDVTQCLNCNILKAKKISLTLMHKVQSLCCEELQSFVVTYVHAEKKRLKKRQPLKTNSVYLFRLINTCRQLRFYAAQIDTMDTDDKDDFPSTTYMLEKLEDHVLSLVQKMMKHMAKENLRSYFKKEDRHIYNLTEAIQRQCASLPQTDEGKEIQTIIVDLAYHCVSHVYLDCLMKSKFKWLERRWGNVEEKIKKDALIFHSLFTKLNCSPDQKNQLLQRISEVLFLSDAEALKSTCCYLFQDFPEESEQYLPGLLRLKEVLSKQQVKEVLELRWLESLNSGRVKCHPIMSICCCVCWN